MPVSCHSNQRLEQVTDAPLRAVGVAVLKTVLGHGAHVSRSKGVVLSRFRFFSRLGHERSAAGPARRAKRGLWMPCIYLGPGVLGVVVGLQQYHA
ncbi:hypothetical protein NDU88_005928 [Pleurodeles waltl]|uniref:Uncharacterized protein n=1 Tax=Pleurodeles waltl TaxID=8319 RepID=A0AAV7VPN5_PLEWA|nr:hypothetical protein NDU88_005928 [Pleurodeles waltl]